MLTYFLLACAEQNEPDQFYFDSRQDWELFSPIGGPDFQAQTKISWFADPSISDRALKASNEWEIHTSCGIDLIKVDDPRQADINITCDDFASENSSFLMTDRSGNVTLSEHACASGGDAMMRYAFAAAMGFPQQFVWYGNIADGSSAWLELNGYESYRWTNIETDGWRAWALERGAPGCGEGELEWSWIKDPLLYRTPPNQETAGRLISLASGADKANKR